MTFSRWSLAVLLLLCVPLELALSQALDPPPTSDAPPSIVSLRHGFADLTLGASLAQITNRLARSAFFDFDQERDLSRIPLSQSALISVPGTDYIERGFLQFDGNALVSIQLILNSQRLDHFSLYRALSEKYGEATALTPQTTTWESKTTRILIERPLIIKYIDLRALKAQQRAAETDTQAQANELDEFFQQL